MELLKKKDMKSSIDKIRIKYPNKIPLFVFRNKKDKNLEELSCNKFLVPDYITVGQFMVIIRKRLKLREDIALFIFIHKNKDVMLVVEYCGENVFG